MKPIQDYFEEISFAEKFNVILWVSLQYDNCMYIV